MEITIYCLISYSALAIANAVLILALREISHFAWRHQVEKDDAVLFKYTET